MMRRIIAGVVLFFGYTVVEGAVLQCGDQLAPVGLTGSCAAISVKKKGTWDNVALNCLGEGNDCDYDPPYL